MIGSLSEQIAKWLNSKKIIEAEDVEVCGYGIFWLLNIIEFLLVSVILGTVLKVLPGALSFFISFLLLRLFGGGFHMDTELKCQITSLALITAFIIAVKMTAVQKISFFMLLAAAAGTVDGLVCVLEDVVCAVVAQSGAVIRVAASVIVFIISIL